MDIMNDVFDLQEVDEPNVKMGLFAQSLGGDVKKWFRSLLQEVWLTLMHSTKHF